MGDIWHKPDARPEMRDLVMVIVGNRGDLKVMSVYAGDSVFVFQALSIIQWAYADEFFRSIGLEGSNEQAAKQ